MNIPAGPILELVSAAVNGIVDLIEREKAKQKKCRACRNLMLRQSVHRCFILGTMMPPEGPPWGECSFWEKRTATDRVAPTRKDPGP